MVLNLFITSFYTTCRTIIQPTRADLDIDRCGAVVEGSVVVQTVPATSVSWGSDFPIVIGVSSTSVNPVVVVLGILFCSTSVSASSPYFSNLDMGFSVSRINPNLMVFFVSIN